MIWFSLWLGLYCSLQYTTLKPYLFLSKSISSLTTMKADHSVSCHFITFLGMLAFPLPKDKRNCFTVNTLPQGTISDRTFQTSLFSKPPDIFSPFLHIQRERHCNNLPQLSRKQHFFGKRDKSLLLGNNHRR